MLLRLFCYRGQYVTDDYIEKINLKFYKWFGYLLNELNRMSITSVRVFDHYTNFYDFGKFANEKKFEKWLGRLLNTLIRLCIVWVNMCGH